MQSGGDDVDEEGDRVVSCEGREYVIYIRNLREEVKAGEALFEQVTP